MRWGTRGLAGLRIGKRNTRPRQNGRGSVGAPSYFSPGLDREPAHPSKDRTSGNLLDDRSSSGWRRAMTAYIWHTHHGMWKVVPPFEDSFDVLKAYITDPSAYVYWSTPRFQSEIKPGDIAFI